jgi:YHS domain-containing protein
MSPRRKWITLLSLLVVIAVAAIVIQGSSEGEPMNSQPGVAIQGYDVVSYFTKGEPVQGSKDFPHSWNGTTWYFSSAENRDLFAKNPEKYAPQYGGACAFATSLGKKEVGSPKHWTIKDGKLYLNSNAVAGFLWKILPGRVDAAEKNWTSKSQPS